MSYLDTLYRAFTDFRKITANDGECASQRRLIAKTDADEDCVEVTRVVCTIDEVWIDTIEQGLEFIEKSLAEERQFIQVHGEVVPIEKVKRISRDSVVHLSKHGNLITQKSDSGELVPEQLYTVERLNDYAVYENRFLYMLLTYLEEFISVRYTKIQELTNTYDGKLKLSKTVNSRQREITFTLNLEEKRQGDPIMAELNPNKAVIERIGMLLKTVGHYLATPLMEEVGKAAKLKPPITKTNVLRMDKNFKGAVKLYEFIAAYDKDGYTVTTEKKKMKFSEVIADEFAELYCLSSFLTYEYGVGIKEMLKAGYEDEEARRRAVAENGRLEQLRKLRRRIEERGESAEEYILLLEKQLRELEVINAKLDEQKAECDRLLKENDEIKENCRSQIDSLTEQCRARLEEQRDKSEREITDLSNAHRDEISAIVTENEKILEQKQSEIEGLAAANAALEKAKRDIVSELEAKHAAVVKELGDSIKDKDNALADEQEKNRLLSDLKTLSDGRLNALKAQFGLMTEADDFTSEEAFNELENQYNTFRKFFKSEWKKTKKKIRDELLRARKTAVIEEHSPDGEGEET